MSSLPNTLLPPLELRVSLKALLALFSPARELPIAERPAEVQTCVTPIFELVEHLGTNRATVETFISQRYAESFGSRVESFMPRLFSMRNRDGDICGAFGLRSASRKLFLEQYFDTPIDRILMERLGKRIERRAIVEVGHFSGVFPGAVRAMIGLLTEHLHRAGFEWVVFTGTSALRNAFSRLGLSPIDIQAASIDRLPEDERAAWGQYYEHAPHVLVGNVQDGFEAMRQHALSSRVRSVLPS